MTIKEEDLETLCFKDFLAWHRRSGGALVAESDAQKKIEAQFGKFYVMHVADLEILSTIQSNIGEEAFIMEIVGVPGVGKTKMLGELISGLNPEEFEPKYKAMIKQIVEAYEFLDIDRLPPASQRKQSKMNIGRKKVWVTLNIDEFVSITKGVNPLVELYEKLNSGLYKGESLIICGNIGVLENDEAKEAISKIHELMSFRNQRPKIKFVRFPLYESLYWTKEYGVNVRTRYGVEEDPSFLVSGREGFQKYSSELVALGCRILHKCLSMRDEQPKCKVCSGSVYLGYVQKLKELLEDEDFANRLHDLLQFMWLKHQDVYLVARTLNIFWGYALSELWEVVEKNGISSSNKVDKSLIHTSIYSSKLPSIYSVNEHNLSETCIHRFRDTAIEKDFIASFSALMGNPEFRLRKRLGSFFERLEKTEYRGKIYGGLFEEYLEEAKLAAFVTDISKKLVLMRIDKSLLYIPENDERSKELFREPWGFEQLMLGTKVTGIRRENGQNVKVPLMIFHESVLNEVGLQYGVAFEEVQHPSYYLANREKVLRLKLRLGNGVLKEIQKKAPSLHIGLLDYISLRNLVKGVGKPDISLKMTTQVKVISFLNAIEGFVTHEIRPILWKYLKRDVNISDSSRILVRTLGQNTRRGSLKFREKEVTIELDGAELLRSPKEVFS